MTRIAPFLLLVLAPIMTRAAVPGFIPYSGRLTDGTGAGQSLVVDLTLAVYDAAEGGALVFEGRHPAVSVIDGYFSVNLGMCSADGACVTDPMQAVFPVNLPDLAWLSVRAGSGPELTRQPIGSGAYALRCGSSRSIDGVGLGGLDERFVQAAGDTLTGALVLPSNGLRVGGTQLVTANGNLGIGTASPSQKLTVVNGGIKVEATSTGEAGVLLKTPTSDWLVMANDAWAGGDIVFYNNETSQSAVRISENGTVTMLGACNDVGSGQCANDVAESFEAVEPVEPGDVVVLDPSGFKAVALARSPYDTLAVGVVSTAPTLTMGATMGASDVPIALAGVVPVKASVESGPIRPGDLLTTSSSPGLAMRATRRGPMVGKALSEIGADGRVWALIGGAGGCPDDGDLRAEVQRQRIRLEAQREAIDALRAEVEALKAHR